MMSFPFGMPSFQLLCLVSFRETTLQETNISHLGKRKIIFKSALGCDILVFWRVIFNKKNLTCPTGHHTETPIFPSAHGCDAASVGPRPEGPAVQELEKWHQRWCLADPSPWENPAFWRVIPCRGEFWASSTNNLMEICWEFILWITIDRKKTGKHGIERLRPGLTPKKEQVRTASRHLRYINWLSIDCRINSFAGQVRTSQPTNRGKVCEFSALKKKTHRTS